MLSQEKINANFVTYCKKLEKYGCYSEEMMKVIGDKIKNCPFGMNEDSGGAYQGGMVDVVLHNLCKLAHNINELGLGGGEKPNHPFLKVNSNMLFRVLLLQHIAKAEMFVRTEEQWKIKKGFLYDFNDSLTSSLKLGERSIYLCQKYGITLEEEEYEAMRIIDREECKYDFFASPLALLVKFVNVLTATELKIKYEKSFG